MSISSALHSAMTGLNAVSRQAEAASSNVANATTPGYAKRSVMLTSLTLGGSGQGVKVVGILRHSDIFLLNDRRNAEALAAESATRAGFLARLEAIVGTTESSGSLVSAVSALDTALLEAISRPESQVRLSAAVAAAAALTKGLASASKALQAERLKADAAISTAVAQLNSNLKQVEELNQLIATYSTSGGEISALIDQRQRVIDEVARLIPVKEIAREGNRVALISTGGAVLVDSFATDIGFAPVNTIVPEMSLQSGALSALSFNGKPVASSGPVNLIRGGELSALFAIRDEMSVEGQALLDSMARDLIERFSENGLDPTLAPGAPGLFTDAGSALDPALELGLSARLRLNIAVDPLAGGDVLRLRDGLGAVVPGPAGDNALLNALSQALNDSRVIPNGPLSGSRSLPTIASDLLSHISSRRIAQESQQAFAVGRYNALADLEASAGVNIDEEMQSLLVIERNYAANARVLQVIDEMINVLLGL